MQKCFTAYFLLLPEHCRGMIKQKLTTLLFPLLLLLSLFPFPLFDSMVFMLQLKGCKLLIMKKIKDRFTPHCV